MEFFKAVFLGGLLTGIFSLVVGSTGTKAGWLAIHTIHAGQYDVLWSWPLFFAMTGMAWGLMMLQR